MSTATAKKFRDMQRKRRHRERIGQADIGTAERHQHGHMELVETIDAGIKQARDLWVCWLHKLNDRGQLNDRQLSAGEQLYADFVASGLARSPVGSYEGGGGGSRARKHGKRPSERVPNSDPFLAYTAAMHALPYQVRMVVRSVVVEDISPTEAVRSAPNGVRGLVLLQEGLDKLGDHYGWPYDRV